MLKALRRRVHTLLEEGAPDDLPSRCVDVFLGVLIGSNVVAAVVGTIEPLPNVVERFLNTFELLSVWIFGAEYLLRLWSCVEREEYRRPVLGRFRFAFTPLALVDLCAIAPALIPLVSPVDLRSLRIIRLVRMGRLFKAARYSTTLRSMGRVIAKKREELTITVYCVVVLLVTASTLIYFAERDAQPDKFSSIPASMWWAVCTLTTVGYGDVFPVTFLGRLVGGISAVLGIGVFALPAGILGSGFIEEMRSQRSASRICPHCGKPV